MNDSWKLSDTFYLAFHHWPRLMVLILAGCAAGWLMGYVFPANYRATAEVYIALNPYRARNDSEFLAVAQPKYTNIDDYKNWQMAQLDAFIQLDHVLTPTWNDLSRQDSSWSSMQPADLRQILHSEWRNPGSWEFVANHPQAGLAEQAALAWADNATQAIEFAVTAAQEAIRIDEQIIALNAETANLNRQIQERRALLENLRAWQAASRELAPDQPLPVAQRWRVVHLATLAADFKPGWQQLLANEPDPDSPAREYFFWANEFEMLLETESSALASARDELETRVESLTAEYAAVYAESKGLSASLEVQQIQFDPAQQMRTSPQLALIGGLIAICGWLITILYTLSRPGSTT